MSCAQYGGVIYLLIDPLLASTAGLSGAALKDAARNTGVAMRAATALIPTLPVVAQASQGTVASRTSSSAVPPRPSVRASVDLPATVIHQQNVIALQGLELQYARVRAELAVQTELETRTRDRLWRAGLEAEFSGWEVTTTLADEEDFPSPPSAVSSSVSYGSSAEESDRESDSASSSEERSEDAEASEGDDLAGEVTALHSEAERELDAVAKERGFDWRRGESSRPSAPK